MDILIQSVVGHHCDNYYFYYQVDILKIDEKKSILLVHKKKRIIRNYVYLEKLKATLEIRDFQHQFTNILL